MTIAYILSGKNGITSFTYRELELLESHGIGFHLCFTKLNLINNLPKPNWGYSVLNRKQLIVSLVRAVIKPQRAAMLLKAYRAGEIKEFVAAVNLADQLAEVRPDGVHVQMADAKLLIGFYMSKLLKVQKFTCTVHAHELYSEMRYNRLERFRNVLNACTKVFTISEYNRNLLIADIGVLAERITVMRLYPSFTADLDLQHKVKFLVTANWEIKKGFEEILAAAKKIDREDFVLLIAGRNVNPEVDLNLTKIVREEKLENKIFLLGHLNMTLLKVLYSSCDVFLLPSKTEYYPDGKPKEREGIPVAIMEAMSFGMPVISTYHAGIPELVEQYLIEEGDADALAEIMVRLIGDIGRVKAEAASNVGIIRDKYSDNNIMALVNEYKGKA